MKTFGEFVAAKRLSEMQDNLVTQNPIRNQSPYQPNALDKMSAMQPDNLARIVLQRLGDPLTLRKGIPYSALEQKVGDNVARLLISRKVFILDPMDNIVYLAAQYTAGV